MRKAKQPLHSEKQKTTKVNKTAENKQPTKQKLKRNPSKFKRLAKWQHLLQESEHEEPIKRKEPIKATVTREKEKMKTEPEEGNEQEQSSSTIERPQIIRNAPNTQ